MSTSAKNLIQKIQDLPPERVDEVADFVDFLLNRHGDRFFVEAAKKLSADSFKQAWDNPEDADYDKL